MWSHRHNVNLLAAGGNLPSAGSTGSGIYSGSLGALAYEFSNTPLTRLVVADLPITPGQLNRNLAAQQQEKAVSTLMESNAENKNILPGLEIWKEQMNDFRVEFFNWSAGREFKGRICIYNINNVCCDYDIAVQTTIVDTSVSQMKSMPCGTHNLYSLIHSKFELSVQKFYSYAVAVFNGHRSYATTAQRKLHTKQMICSVVACTTYGKRETCGSRIVTDSFIPEFIQFDRLSLTAHILTAESGQNQTVAMANTLTRDIIPMDPNDFQFNWTLAKNPYVTEIRNHIHKNEMIIFFSLFFVCFLVKFKRCNLDCCGQGMIFRRLPFTQEIHCRIKSPTANRSQ